ncbi:hypothetical protein VTJ83DRAFT_1733 [Remersonia thermophila]|uniref:2-dehydropantoate 2-reductase n=1 Tax=Remersonia thermophila TaxID=72144 RepID=A0ABR4DJ27_9PEZI
MVGRGASRRVSGVLTTTASSAAQDTASYVPWSRKQFIPPRRAPTHGPMAVPPLQELLSNEPSAEEAPEEQRLGSTPESPREMEADAAAPTRKGEADIDGQEAVPAKQPGPAGPGSRGTAPEPEKQPELDRIRSKVALWDADERQARAARKPVRQGPLFETSDQLHVMGLNLTGRYIAHTLAGCQTIPPVRYILHSRSVARKWRQAGEQLVLQRGVQVVAHTRVIGEYAPLPDSEPVPGSGVDPEVVEPIANLIVTLPAAHVVRAIGRIRHRLDHRSTICLVNDGLGVAEALVEAYFPNELTRPVFVLGHFTTSLGHTTQDFSVAEIRPGRLYLSLLATHGRREPGQHLRIKRHPPPERTVRATHLIRLLSAIPGLHATGHPMHDFLRYKLPSAVFRTVVDPVAALLDCRYDQLARNAYARQLMDRLFGEVAQVMSLVPECRDSEKLRRYVTSTRFRDDVFHKLMRQRTADSRMRSLVGRGFDTDIDFLSGYFVRRGHEVQAPPLALDSVMWAVKARQLAVMEDMARDIPFQET